MNIQPIIQKISSQKSHWIRGFLIGLVISILVSILSYLGHFRNYENPFTSVLQQVLGKKSKDVVLLFITEDEYKNGFNAYSPLSRTRLAKTIDVLVKLKAKVIALDIDLSDQTDDDHFFMEAVNRARKSNIPIVLPSILKPSVALNGEKKEFSSLHPYLPESYKKNKAGYILYEGSNLQKELLDICTTGGALFALDRDGVFRNGTAFYHMFENGVDKIVPSFPMAIAAAYQGISKQELEQFLSAKKNHNIALSIPGTNEIINIHYGSKGTITPNFLGNYEHFERLIDLDSLLKSFGKDQPGGNTVFENKIVIVGGSFDRNDFYQTPVGRMSGIEIVGNITQNITDHNLISHLSFWKAFIFEVLLGAIVALLFILFSPLKAIAYCFITLIPITVFLSLIAFSAVYYWFDFIPTIAGVMLHGIISKAEQGLRH